MSSGRLQDASDRSASRAAIAPNRLSRLSLKGFRNLHDQQLEFPEGGVAVVGANAQGKSNLLEAIYYLEMFRSFRGAGDEQLVRFGADHFRVEGDCRGEADQVSAGTRTVSVAYRNTGADATKRISVDGTVATRVSDAIGEVAAVVFTPEDVRVVSDGPRERRRFLDVLLSLNTSGYLADLQTFRHALAQRNAALRRARSDTEVAAWNHLLIQAGSAVTWKRATWVHQASEGFGNYYREVAGASSDAAQILYDASVPGAFEALGLDEVESVYARALETARPQERARRTTWVGPHRDEVRFLVAGSEGGRDVRQFGSGGQRRTVAIALRLLEADTVRRCRGREPILLLDDVFAELDEARSQRVLHVLDQVIPGQVILTAPKEDDVRLRGGTLPRWSVREGEVLVG